MLWLLLVLVLSNGTGHADDGMAYIPAGEFTMGNPPGDDAFDDESPQRRVYVSAFWMDRYEVTNEEYKTFVRATAHRVPENVSPQVTVWERGDPLPGIDRHPVINIGWTDADDYCRWAGKRLPTEAEWEKAARGTDARRYPWGNEWELTLANSASYWARRTVEFKTREDWHAFWIAGEGALLSREHGVKGEVLTLPVGSFQDGASPYGLHDMAGNASEWVSDWYEPYFFLRGSLSDPTGPERGILKVMRGGSWLKPARNLRTGDRDYGDLQTRPSGTGFRCAKDDR